MRNGRPDYRERGQDHSYDDFQPRYGRADESSEFEQSDSLKYSRTNQKLRSNQNWRENDANRLAERATGESAGLQIEHPSKNLSTKHKQLQELMKVEEAYRDLLEKTLPDAFISLLQHPILFTETVNALFIIVNDFLDERIRSMLHSLGQTLGIPENKLILLHILLTYPNSLERLDEESMNQLCYSIRESLNTISLRRNIHFIKTRARIQTQSTSSSIF